ncbi:hypothetical protein E2C01_089065 [Portunus trituberculatus]|uniref:Uncharacterized protein n=1 Tax=Portunus trituberculatus TaxID=210409 RepID=A0A5B7JLJ0_PORTR|nr:hypothetical protein [Portunus trituberculatus]
MMLEVIVQLLPGAVAKPHMLEQHTAYPGLLLGGIQWLMGSGLAALEFVQHHGDLLVVVLGVLQGQLDGHQISL